MGRALICTYSYTQAIKVLLFGLSFTIVGIVVAIFHDSIRFGGNPMDPDVGRSVRGAFQATTPTLFGAAFAVAGVITVGLGIYYAIAAKNEKIILDNETITWIGASGAVRVKCSTSEIIPGTFRKRLASRGSLLGARDSDGTLVQRYEVGTRIGLLTWSPKISNSEELLREIKLLSRC